MNGSVCVTLRDYRTSRAERNLNDLPHELTSSDERELRKWCIGDKIRLISKRRPEIYDILRGRSSIFPRQDVIITCILQSAKLVAKIYFRVTSQIVLGSTTNCFQNELISTSSRPLASRACVSSRSVPFARILYSSRLGSVLELSVCFRTMFLIAMFVADVAYSAYRLLVPGEHEEHYIVVVQIARHAEPVAQGA
jgi:hypothetical protein